MSGWLVASLVLLWVVVLVTLGLSLLIFRQLGIMVMGTARGVNDSGIPAGRRLPALRLRSVTGAEWSPDAQAGRPYLLFFGAPHCRECAELMPSLRGLADDTGVQLVTLMFAGPGEARAYASEHGLPEPVVPIGEREAKALDVEVTPFAYAVDAGGVIRDKGLANSVERIRRMAGSCGGRVGDGDPLPVVHFEPQEA